MNADKLSEATGRNQRKIATKNTKKHKKNYLATDESTDKRNTNLR